MQISCKPRISQELFSKHSNTPHPTSPALTRQCWISAKMSIITVNLKNCSQKLVVGTGGEGKSYFANVINSKEKPCDNSFCTHSIPTFCRNQAKTWAYYVMRVISKKQMPNPLCLHQAISLESCLMLLQSSRAKDGHVFLPSDLYKVPHQIPVPNKKPGTHLAIMTHFQCSELVQCHRIF